MTHARAGHAPFDFVASEVAAAPLSDFALPFGLTHLEPLLSRSKVGGDLVRESPTAKLWRATETDLLRRFRGFSVDEVTAYRDAVWFAGARDPRTNEEKATPVPLAEYLRRLAEQVLEVDGAFLRPKVPLWGHPTPLLTEGAGPAARAARRTWRWVTFSLPWDLLASALPRAVPATEEVTWLSPQLDRWLRDRGFAEMHCHLGATPDFRELWVWAIRAAAERNAHPAMFRSPGAEQGEGSGLGAKVLLSAIARLILADFLRLHAAAPLLDLDLYLRGSDGDKRSIAADSLLARTGDAGAVRQALRALRGDQPVSRADHAIWAEAYRLLARQAGDTYQEPWERWIERGSSADPLAPLVPRVVERMTCTPEMRWSRACIAYLDGASPGEGGSAVSGRARDDALFARLFWQAIRVRVALYRHLVLRPLTPGLQWFTRTFARIGPARRGVPRRSLAATALKRAGDKRGLASFEVRIAPEDRLDNLRAAVHAVWQGCGGIRPPELGDLPEREHPRAVTPECGLVIHFTKRRGGGMEEGIPKANGRGSEADPAAPQNVSQYRYGRYFQVQSRQARIVAEMFRRWPACLHFVRGVDVCTDEAGVPTWVIAPLFRIVRRAAGNAAIASSRIDHEPPPLRATAHAGEDFLHLLTGLRRIDEALTHLVNREGDRLGHAVALGVDPRQWAERARHVMMTREERLFDLAWEWQFYDEGRAPATGDRTRAVASEIRRLSEQIFGQSLPARELVDVASGLYQERELFDLCGFPGDGWKPRAREKRVPKSSSEKLVQYLRNPRLFDRGMVLTGVDVVEEIPALVELQRALRQRASQQGIAVEVNPTSNLLIGDMADLSNHPLWHLRPLTQRSDEPAIDVCIGSDDPLTFATTLRDEYQLILDTLEQGGATSHDARAWLEDARKAGMVYRFTLPTWRRDPFAKGFLTEP